MKCAQEFNFDDKNVPADGQFNFDGKTVPADRFYEDGLNTSNADPDHISDNRESLNDDNYLSDSEFEYDKSEVPQHEAEDAGEGQVLLQVGGEDPHVFSFKLSPVPGGEYQEDPEPELEVEEDDDIKVEDDPWSWKVDSFLSWLSARMQSVPRHSGRDSVGLERAIAYLKVVNKEISKAVRSDINGEIDISAVQRARDELHDGLKRLQQKLDRIQANTKPKKRKKSAEESNNMVKEGKSTHVGGIVVTVPLLISSIARTCINSMVSAGKDIEDVFDKLSVKYELTAREEMETMQLLADMGYAMRRPRGYKRDEEVDYTSTDNFDWSANYPG